MERYIYVILIDVIFLKTFGAEIVSNKWGIIKHSIVFYMYIVIVYSIEYGIVMGSGFGRFRSLSLCIMFGIFSKLEN